jgi:hypothetical protein
VWPISRSASPSNVATVYYSYDGGAWTAGSPISPLTLNDSKVAGCGVAATNDGTTGVAISVDFTYCQVTSSGRASKTVSTMTGGTVDRNGDRRGERAERVGGDGGVSAIPNTSSGAS